MAICILPDFKCGDLKRKSPAVVTYRGTVFSSPARMIYFVSECGYPDRSHTFLNHIQPAGGPLREVNDALPDKRAAIIYAYNNFPAGPLVAHFHIYTERQCLVGGGHRVHIKRFSVAGFTAMEVPAIAAGDPFLREAFMAGKRFIAFAGNCVRFLPRFLPGGLVLILW